MPDTVLYERRDACYWFLQHDSLVLEIFNYLPLLLDVLAWRATSTRTLKVGSEVVATHFTRIVTPFARIHIPELCHTMHVTRALITGSCARKMLTGDESLVNNLNIIVTYGGFDLFHSYIVDTLHYIWIDRAVEPHYAFQSSLQRFRRYKYRDLFITLSEAKVDGIFKVILSSPTTADMSFMTAGGCGTLYPNWTLRSIAVSNQTIFRGNRTTNSLGCVSDPRFVGHDNTRFLTEACGSLCPTLWRYISHRDEQSIIVDWDPRFSLRAMVATSHTVWRLAKHCLNYDCPYNPINNAKIAHLPPIPMPCDLTTIQLQEAQIDRHTPHYAGKRVGLLYGTRAISPHLVSVPLRDGITELTNLSQLETSHWLDHLKLDKFVVSTSRFRKMFSRMPGDNESTWEYAYTCIREDPWTYPPPNALICELACLTDARLDVTSNVLVVKHIKGNKHAVVDMKQDDAEIVDALIKCAVGMSDFWK